MRNKNTGFLTLASVIAALYAVLTYVFFSVSFSGQQLRLSELLTILPVITPAAIPGLVLGCAIANITSPFGIMDIVLGSLATGIAAFFSYLTRNVKLKGIPILSPLFPVIINAALVTLETAFTMNSFSKPGVLIPVFLSVAGSEFVTCYILGIPLYFVIKRFDKENFIK